MNKLQEGSMPQAKPSTTVAGLDRGTEFLLYRAKDDCTRVECRFVDGSLWLSPPLMKKKKGGRNDA